MNSKVMRIALTGGLMAGAIGVLDAAPAQAATKCAIGSWRLLSEYGTGKSVFKDGADGYTGTTTLKGAAGVKLKIGATKAVYSFTGSKPEYLKTVWKFGTTPYVTANTNTYTGGLTIGASVTGTKRGTFATKRKTAKGTAVQREVDTAPPSPAGPSTTRVAMLLKEDADNVPLVPSKAALACTKTRLVLKRKISDSDGMSSTTFSWTLTYRRV